MSLLFLGTAAMFAMFIVWNGEPKRPTTRAVIGLLSLMAGMSAIAKLSNAEFTFLSAAVACDTPRPAVNPDDATPESAAAVVVSAVQEKTTETVVEVESSESNSSASTTSPTSGSSDPIKPAATPADAKVDQIESQDGNSREKPALAIGGVVVSPSRPNWVDSAPVVEGDLQRIVVSSGPHARKRECDKALDEELAAAVEEYIDEYLGSSAASPLVHYSLKDIKRRLVRPENYFYETIQVSFGPMHQGHALIEFDREFRKELDERWERIAATSRLLQAGLSGFGVLTLLGTMFGYFRLDTATKGYYTGRLQLAAVAAILALGAVGVATGHRWFSDFLLYLL